MLRSGGTASWTRDYQEIEDFNGHRVASSTAGAAANVPVDHQELPLLPNREPSPTPASPTAIHAPIPAHGQHQGLTHSPSHPSYAPTHHSHLHEAHVPPSTSTTSSAYSQSSSSHAFGIMPNNAHTNSNANANDPAGTSSTSTSTSRPSMSLKNNNAATSSSPLNPTAASASGPPTPGFARPGSRGSLSTLAQSPQGSHLLPSPPNPQGGGQAGGSSFSRMANEELRALAGPYPNGLTSGLPPTPGARGSMILYRRADSFTSPGLPQGPMAPEEGNPMPGYPGGNQGERNSYFLPPPPQIGQSNRGSMYSVSGDSIVSMAMGDGKYPPSLFSPGTPGTPLHPPLPHVPSTSNMNNNANTRTTGQGLRGPFQGLGVDGARTTSVWSDTRTSVAFSLNGLGGGGGLVAYAYDPDEDDLSEDDEDDWLHDPEVAYPKTNAGGLFGGSKPTSAPAPPPKGAAGVSHSNSLSSAGSSTMGLKGKGPAGTPVPGVGEAGQGAGVGEGGVGAGVGVGGTGEKDERGLRIPHPSKVPPQYRGTASWSWRGVVNITTLIALLAALLTLFMVYPLVREKMDSGVNARITGNTRINATGQAVEGDDVPLIPGGNGNTNSGGIVRSTTRTAATTTRDLNPGGVTFDRRDLRWEVPAATPTGEPPVFRWMRQGSASTGKAGKLNGGKGKKEEEGVKPWPSQAASMPVATGESTVDENVDGWVVVERPAMTREGAVPEATGVWNEDGQEVLSGSGCSGEACKDAEAW